MLLDAAPEASWALDSPEATIVFFTLGVGGLLLLWAYVSK